MDSRADRASLDQVLAIYAEVLVAQGTVAVIGDASAGVGALALRLGARAVYEWDPEPARARAHAERAPRGLTVRPLAREELVRRDFDLVIVPDLAALASSEDVDLAALLADLRVILGENGVALFAARNRDAALGEGGPALDYYELFEAVAAEFDFVRMVAELPFRGIALVELGEDTDADGVSGVSVDTQLGEEGGTPEVFVAIGSQRDVRLDAYAIVQLPPSAAVDDAPLLPSQPLESPLLADLRARADEAAVLETALAERSRRIESLTSELEELRATADAGRLAAVEELDELIARVDRAEKRASDRERELAALEREGHGAEHEAMEARLRERAQLIRELETEVARRDRMIHELAGALEDATGASVRHTPADVRGDVARDGQDGPDSMKARLDAMALDLARREGEAQAAAWQNQELERRLALAEQAAPPSSPTGARLSAALDELEALRSALVQEHDARLRVEARLPRERGAEDEQPVDRTVG